MSLLDQIWGQLLCLVILLLLPLYMRYYYYLLNNYYYYIHAHVKCPLYVINLYAIVTTVEKIVEKS